MTASVTPTQLSLISALLPWIQGFLYIGLIATLALLLWSAFED